MGYDLHITRREDWSDEGFDITAEEWVQYVHKDPELKIKGVNGPCYAVWSGQSEHSEPWLDWANGQIYAKNPDSPLIDKMIAIAKQLGATVQGDDGEIYDEKSSESSAPRPLQSPPSTPKKGFWGRLFGR